MGKTILSSCSPLLLLLLWACEPPTVEEVDSAGFRTIYSVDPDSGQKHGSLKVLDDSGNLVEEANYDEGLLQGMRVLYSESGDTATVEYYLDGQFEGPYRSYYPGGKQIKLEGQYQTDVMTGRWRKYYANGQLQEVVTFADNKENGPFREWFEDGTLAAEGSYQNGDNENGRLRVYNEDGSLNRVMNCDMGICSSIWRDTFPTPPPARELPDFE